MKKQLHLLNSVATSLLCCLLFITNNSTSQITVPTWTFAAGGGNGSYEYGMGVLAQGNNVYMFTRYSGAPTVGGLTVPYNTSYTASGVFKYDLSGAGVWAAGNENFSDDTYPWGFSIDPDGNTYSGGCGNSGGWGYLSKTDVNGNILWRNSVANNGSVDMCISDANGVWGGGATTIVHYTGGGTLSYNANCITATGYISGKGMALHDKYLYVCGGFYGTPTFNPMFGNGAPMTAAPQTGSYGDYFVAKYDTTTGTCVQAFTFANAGIDNGGWYEQNDITVDASGNIYCSGHFQGTADFQGTSLTAVASNDIWVAKLNDAGVLQWVTQAGGSGNDEPYGLALDPSNDVYIAGGFSGTCTFDMHTACQVYTSVGNSNGFVAKYDNLTGQVEWVKRCTADGDANFNGVAVDANYNVWVAGGYSNNQGVTFDNIYVPGYTSSGDIFIAKLDVSATKNIVPIVSTSPYCTPAVTTLHYTTRDGSVFNGNNTFTAQLSDANGNFTGNQINLGSITSTGSGDITVTFPGGLSVGTSYKIRIISSNPADTSDAYCIILNTGDAALAGPDQTVCGTSASLAANTPNTGTGLWTLLSGSGTITDPTSSTSGITGLGAGANVFIWTVTNTICPPSADSVTITGVPVPIVTVNSPTICAGETANLTASGAASYTWSAGATSTGTNTATASPTVSTPYTVTGTLNGCSNTATANVTVNPKPTPAITADATMGCVPFCVQFNETASTNCSSVVYDFGDGNTSSQSSPQNCYAQTGTYSVTITCTDANNCTGATTVSNMITAVAVPKASFTMSPDGTVGTDTPVSFNNTSTGDNQAWDFGDPSSSDNTSTLASPNHSYAAEGTYCVTLVSINSGTCYDSIQHCITIANDPTLMTPNIFTPNGDGKNDLFYITATSVKSLSCTVYDRWGNKMAEWNSVSGSWNGTTRSGGLAPDAVYYYVVKATGLNDKETEKQGYVQLLREK